MLKSKFRLSSLRKKIKNDSPISIILYMICIM